MATVCESFQFVNILLLVLYILENAKESYCNLSNSIEHVPVYGMQSEVRFSISTKLFCLRGIEVENMFREVIRTGTENDRTVTIANYQ